MEDKYKFCINCAKLLRMFQKGFFEIKVVNKLFQVNLISHSIGAVSASPVFLAVYALDVVSS